MVQITLGTYILPLLRPTTLFSSILFVSSFSSSGFVYGLCKDIEIFVLVRSVKGLKSALVGLSEISVTHISCLF